MEIIFTKNTLPLSFLIRWVFKEPVSHVAFVFDKKLVIHSNLLGLQVTWLTAFLKHSTIEYSIRYEMSLEKQEEVYQSLLDAHAGAPYDWVAFFKFAWHGIMWRLFRKPLPTSLHGEARAYFCTEVYELLPNDIVPKLSLPMTVVTPYHLYKLLMEKRT